MKAGNIITLLIILPVCAHAAPSSAPAGDSPARGKVMVVPGKGKEAVTAPDAGKPGSVPAVPGNRGQGRIPEPGNRKTPLAGGRPLSVRPDKTDNGRVVRSTLTSGIVNREPRDIILSLGHDEKKIYYFTELRGMKGRTAIHRWRYQGRVMAEVKFNVKGDRWRIWSSKSLVPGWSGEWQVSVVDDQGRVLATNRFSYTRASAP